MSFAAFATEGLKFPAFAIASGSLMVLVAHHRRRPDAARIAAAPPALRWLLRHDWERRGGWTMIGLGLLIAVARLTGP